jgi:hypothetical protein
MKLALIITESTKIDVIETKRIKIFFIRTAQIWFHKKCVSRHLRSI